MSDKIARKEKEKRTRERGVAVVRDHCCWIFSLDDKLYF